MLLEKDARLMTTSLLHPAGIEGEDSVTTSEGIAFARASEMEPSGVETPSKHHHPPPLTQLDGDAINVKSHLSLSGTASAGASSASESPRNLGSSAVSTYSTSSPAKILEQFLAQRQRESSDNGFKGENCHDTISLMVGLILTLSQIRCRMTLRNSRPRRLRRQI